MRFESQLSICYSTFRFRRKFKCTQDRRIGFASLGFLSPCFIAHTSRVEYIAQQRGVRLGMLMFHWCWDTSLPPTSFVCCHCSFRFSLYYAFLLQTTNNCGRWLERLRPRLCPPQLHACLSVRARQSLVQWNLGLLQKKFSGIQTSCILNHSAGPWPKVVWHTPMESWSRVEWLFWSPIYSSELIMCCVRFNRNFRS